jgi:hypothetical protein
VRAGWCSPCTGADKKGCEDKAFLRQGWSAARDGHAAVAGSAGLDVSDALLLASKNL